MSKLKRRQQTSPVVRADTPSANFGWFALAWAGVVFGAHLHYYSQQIPTTFGMYVDYLSAHIALGPNFGHFWLGHLIRTTAVAFFFLGAWALGDFLLRVFVKPEDGIVEEFRLPFSLGLGIGVLGYTAFGLFVLGIAERGVFAGLFILSCSVAVIRFLRKSHDIENLAEKHTPALAVNGIERILAGSLLVALLFAFIGTTQPEISYDALTYHLAVPQAYLFAGRMVDLPHNHFSYLPLLSSMLYSWGLAIDGMYSAKLISFGVGFGILIGLYRWGVVLQNRTLGLLSCTIFLSTPLVIYLFWVSNSDFAASFFLLLMLMAAWTWLRDPDRNYKLLYFAGVFGGLALVSKYTAIFGVGILTLFLAWRSWKARQTNPLRRFIFYCIVLALPATPWLVRNYIYTGNPAAPYLSDKFGRSPVDPEILRDRRSETSAASPGLNIPNHLKKIWRDAVVGFENGTYNYIGPVFVGFSLLACLALGSPWARLLASFGVASILLGLSATYVTRLLIGYYVPLALVLGYALSEIISLSKIKYVALALFVSMVAFNIYLLSSMFIVSIFDGHKVALGQETPSEYLKRPHNYYGNPTFGAYEFIGNLRLPKENRILVAGESRGFYSPNFVINNAPRDVPVVFSWASSSKNPAELYDRFRANNVEIFLINQHEGPRNDPPKYITSRDVAMIAAVLERYFNKVYSDSWTVVYRQKAKSTSP